MVDPGPNGPRSDETTVSPGPAARGLSASGPATGLPAQQAQGEKPVVPGYEVLEELGRGGMGVVFQARQLGLNRMVALKMILTGGLADEPALARFRTEAEAVARLQHPHIIQIYETGIANGRPFFSMERVGG